MSASDAAPLPRLGEVFFDVRGSSRSMRLSWYSDTGVAVFSIWQGGTCTGTFRLPIDDLPRMVEALQRGPRGAALPAGESRDLGAERQRRGITAAPTEAMPPVASFSDYATGQIAPVTGEFRSFGAADPSYGGDPLGSGSYPAYRDRDNPGGSFPGYAGGGPPVYRDSSPPPSYRDDPLGAPSYRDDPLGAPSYRDDPLGSGSYRDHSLPGHGSLPGGSLPGGSLPGHRDSDPYGGDPLGSGSYPAYRDRDNPDGSFPGYADDGPPVYRDSSRPPSYGDDPLGAPSYRDDPLGSGSYRDQSLPGGSLSGGSLSGGSLSGGSLSGGSLPGGSLPGHRDSDPYGGDPLGSGYRSERPPSYRDERYPPAYRDEAASYPADAPGPRYSDDPFQSVYPDNYRETAYPDDTRPGSQPYGLPPDRPEPRAPRGRS